MKLKHYYCLHKNCRPIYVEAREAVTKFDWLGSTSKLVYPINASDSETMWALGISSKIGYGH